MNHSRKCPPDADNKFGPSVVGCRDDFDFTLLFEQSILSFAPTAVLLLLSVPRIVQLHRRVAILCSACLRLALLILWITHSRIKTRFSIAAASLSFAATLILAILSNLEHSRSARPSFIINTYLLFTTLLDLAQVRTLWLMPGDWMLASVFTGCVAFNLVLMVFESTGKRSFLRGPFNAYPPEALSGIFSRSVFWWLNGLFVKGYNRILTPGDLFEIDEELSSLNLQSRMRLSWQRFSTYRNHALLRTTVSAFHLPLMKVIFPRLCVIALKFSQPLLIKRAVSLISQPRTVATRNDGYGLIGATALIYFGLAIGNATYKHKNYRSLTMVRGGLISLISDVTLSLDASSSNDSAAVTLMSTDVDRIVSGLEYWDFIWASPIEIAIALYLLWREVGLSCLMPLAISLGSAAAGYFVGIAAAAAQKNWVDAVQKRVSVTASMLGSMKAVKMMGLSTLFSDRVQKLKVFELKQSNKFRYITTTRNIISNFSLFTAPALTFALYTSIKSHSSGSSFNPAAAFTSLSIIALLSQSVQWWVIALFMFQASLGCYERIEKYLLSETRSDARLCTVTANNFFGTENGVDIPGLIDEPLTERNDHPISIINGYSGYKGHDSPIIKEINLRVRSSTLTMVIGPVGCGKSTLLKSLLGEMPSMSGEFLVAASAIGYCAQDPWLPNYSIKEIITGFLEFDDAWYRVIVQTCALDEDIRHFSAGDDTLVGSKGVSLSGGQKQRLALARALYARNRILVLDDVLSGLDKITEQDVFRRVLGREGLCRTHGTTVVLATHAVKYLPHADHVVVFSRDGKISEQGPPTQLSSHNQWVEAAMLPEIESHKDDLMIPDSPPKTHETKLQDQQVASTRSEGDLKIYAYYAGTAGWLLTLFLCTQVITTFLIKFPDVWLRWWSTAEASHPGQRTHFYLGIYCMFAGLALFSVASEILTLFIGVMPRSSTQMHRRLLSTVISAPYAFLAATDVGVILNRYKFLRTFVFWSLSTYRFSQDMSLIDMQLPVAVLQTSDGLMLCIAQAILIAASSKYVATIIPAAAGILYLLQRFYLRTSRQMRLLDLEFKSPMYTHFLETLSGLHTIRAFNWRSAWEERSRVLLDRSSRPAYLLYCIQRWLELSLDGMVAVCAIVVITLATQLHENSSTVGGALGVALVNLLNMSSMLSYLIRAWTDMETSIGAVLRIRDFESTTPSEINRPYTSADIPSDWPQKGTVEICNLNATYDISNTSMTPGAAPNLVLRDVTLSIPPRTRIGICGRTGSGKSSLLLALFQMIEITGGSITIDGVDISSIPQSVLRERILCVPQNPELFPGSIRENIDPFNISSDDSIISALDTVGLWTTIEARGGLSADASIPLSAGERQVFALAYALLRRKSVQKESGMLVLDEFSASVDVDTERKIMGVIGEHFSGFTVLSVAHRLQTIKDCDLVAVMDRGRIVEVGKPSSLRTIDLDNTGAVRA